MIPADVASRLQISADAAARPVAPAQDIADKLAGLVAGQKVMAEIQAMLPNGTYRAMINQRSVTLALPFAAKSGDSLELQVTENDGKLAFAVLSGPNEQEAATSAGSSSATLSRTGQLISNLYAGSRDTRNSATPLPLNNNQPIAEAPPNSAQDILPQLRQAISQSGMFYESHQAEWVEGRFTKAALLQEPQGKLSEPMAFASAHAETKALPEPGSTPTSQTGSNGTTPRVVAPETSPTAASTSGDSTRAGASAQTPAMAPQTQPLVQQQLEALATQTFAWQGQVWPGQSMQWAIDADASGHEEGDEAAHWTTRLSLTLPTLGQVDARIRLQNNQVTLSIHAPDPETRTKLRTAGVQLRQQFDEAGLVLASMGISSAENENSSDQGQE